MSHMVIYRTGDGQPGYHQAEELDEAVKFVERLRNGDGVDGARIFRMEEVNFDFRPYFKVEIGPSGEPTDVPYEPTPAPAAAPAPEVMAAPEPEPLTVPEPEPLPAPEPELVDPPLAEAPSLPAEPVGRGDAWGDLGDATDEQPEPTPLVEQAAAFMPDPDDGAGSETNGDHADEGVGARRGLFGR